MGVISNKVNILELMKSGGGGDPTIPGRVSALETETAGLIEANAKIMTSVAALDIETVALAEANAKIMTSVSAMDLNITALDTTVGDSNSGLVKDVAGLQTTVGDSNSGLVKDVAGLDTQINAQTTGLEDRVEALEQGGGGGTDIVYGSLVVTYTGADRALKQNLFDLYGLLSDLYNTLATGDLLIIDKIYVNNYRKVFPGDSIFLKGTDTIPVKISCGATVYGSNLQTPVYQLFACLHKTYVNECVCGYVTIPFNTSYVAQTPTLTQETESTWGSGQTRLFYHVVKA